MFRATNSPIFQEHLLLYIQLWSYNAPTFEMERVPSQPCHRLAAMSVHFTKAVHTVKSALEDRRVCRPKHVQQIQIDQ